MPMEPTDMMWMSKAPTVSEVVVRSNVTFKPAPRPRAMSVSTGSFSDSIRPDFDTDCLWKSHAPSLSRKERTTSLDSNDSDAGRRSSFTENIAGTDQPDVMRPRRISITERILGCQAGGFSWGQAQAQYTTPGDQERKSSITTDERFKELLKHQNKILSD